MQWLCRHCAEEVQLRLLLQVLVCHQFFLTWDLQERENFFGKRKDIEAESSFWVEAQFSQT